MQFDYDGKYSDLHNCLSGSFWLIGYSARSRGAGAVRDGLFGSTETDEDLGKENL